MSTFTPLTISGDSFIAISPGYYQNSITGFGDATDILRIGSISQNQRKDRSGNTYREYILPITRTLDVYIDDFGFRPVTLTCTLRVPEGLPSSSTADQVFTDIADFTTPERLSQMLTGRR